MTNLSQKSQHTRKTTGELKLNKLEETNKKDRRIRENNPMNLTNKTKSYELASLKARIAHERKGIPYEWPAVLTGEDEKNR